MARTWPNTVGWLHILMTAKAFCTKYNVDIYKYVTPKDATKFTPFLCIYIYTSIWQPGILRGFASVEVGVSHVIRILISNFLIE
jgi:hypothetical protein